MAIVESLAISGEVIPDHNLILLTLAGLGGDFEPLIENVITRNDKVTFCMLKTMLMELEVKKERKALYNPMSFNVATETMVKTGKGFKGDDLPGMFAKRDINH